MKYKYIRQLSKGQYFSALNIKESVLFFRGNKGVFMGIFPHCMPAFLLAMLV